MSGPKRAVFFDRDGIVNRRLPGDYVKRWGEFEFLPDILGVLPLVHQAGFLAVIVSNQRGIARGLMTGGDLDAVHETMQSELIRLCGHAFDAIYHCPHNYDDGCDCRKPHPGMLFRAAREMGLDTGGSWMIGDSETDIQAGHAAGCHAAKVDPELRPTAAEVLSANLFGAWEGIMGSLVDPAE